MLVRSRLRIRIALRHPAGDVLGVVLVPVDALRDRNHRDEVDHHRLELLDDRVLRRGARGSAVLVDERVRLWIGIALPVRRCGLTDRRRVLRVEQLAQLVVRGRPTGLVSVVRELVLAVVDVGVVRRAREILGRDLDPDRLQLLLDHLHGGHPVRVPADVEDPERQGLPGRCLEHAALFLEARLRQRRDRLGGVVGDLLC